MTLNDEEKFLLDKLREHDKPEQAILVAIEVILDHLKQKESSQ